MTTIDHTPIYSSLAARLADPDTSHMAVPTGQRIRTIQVRILAILDERGPMTHSQIRDRYIRLHGMTPGSSPASIRSRTSELHEIGGVKAVDRLGITPSGRSATRWDIYRDGAL